MTSDPQSPDPQARDPQAPDPGVVDTHPGRPSPSAGEKAFPWILGIVVGVVIGAVGMWLLTRGGDSETVSGNATTTVKDSGTATPDTTASDTAPGEAGDGSSTTIDAGAGGITVPEGAATTPVSVPAPGMAPTGIVSVNTARHEGFDRVVFEFDRGVPGYEVRYVDGPVYEDGSGKEVAVDGHDVVTVRMTPASVARSNGNGYDKTYDGPDRIAGSGSVVTEVVQAGDFEAQSTWAIGLSDRVDFAVSTLSSPDRLVIDFVNH